MSAIALEHCVNFYKNDTDQSKDATYQLENTGQGSLSVEVLDEKGDRVGSPVDVDLGKTEDHTFTVPKKGKLHCVGGTGKATFLAVASVAMVRSEQLQSFAADVFRLAEIATMAEHTSTSSSQASG
jgi:hypothetical protein